MNRILLILSIISLGVKGLFAQTSSQVSPINVAIKIVEDLDTAHMAATCRYYGLIETQSKGKFKVFNSPDGTEIRLAMTSEGPIIEVMTKQKLKQIKSQLEANGFFQPDKSDLFYEDATRQITIDKKASTILIQKRPLKKYD